MRLATIAGGTALALGILASPASAGLPEPSEAKARTVEAQLRLNALGLEKQLVPDGVYGPRTDGALDAWRGRPGDWVTADDLERLRAATAGGWTARIDKDTQRTRISHRGIPVGTVRSGTATGAYHRGLSGKVFRAVTPNGDYRIQREKEGWNASSSVDGSLFDAHYLVGGIAMHGSLDPGGRSAGCARYDTFVMAALDNLFGVGDRVVVQGSDPAAPVSGRGSKGQPR